MRRSAGLPALTLQPASSSWSWVPQSAMFDCGCSPMNFSLTTLVVVLIRVALDPRPIHRLAGAVTHFHLKRRLAV